MPYIAMTAAEIKNSTFLPPKIAWMACHFSQTNKGLENLPSALPAGSLIILDDSFPLSGHDSKLIARQLMEAVEKLRVDGILLDLQRKDPHLRQIAAAIAALPCPKAITPPYAQDLNCAIFLPPVPPSTPIEKHLKTAGGKEIWLELAANTQKLTLTPKGCNQGQCAASTRGFKNQSLCCHYSISAFSERAEFNLWRTKSDLAELAAKAQALGARHCIGLWQELK